LFENHLKEVLKYLRVIRKYLKYFRTKEIFKLFNSRYWRKKINFSTPSIMKYKESSFTLSQIIITLIDFIEKKKMHRISNKLNWIHYEKYFIL